MVKSNSYYCSNSTSRKPRIADNDNCASLPYLHPGLKSELPQLKTVFNRHDNAGCYHYGAAIVGAGFTGCSSGIFKVWFLGNNVYEKYAFTFIQHSRSTFWLISTKAYNPEVSKYHLLLGRFHKNDPSYKMGRVSFCSGTNRPLAPSARAQDIRVCCVKWVSVPNQSTGHMAAWDMVSKGICIRSY